MTDYDMFTNAGNAAVEAIVVNSAAHFETFEDAYVWAEQELEYLSRTSTFSEATDTAVREAVYTELRKEFPAIIFRSVRA